ncbi:putative signal transduction response regulator, receiver domain protein [Candidatus Nitrososphaera gargensis Ga9.2]|uniref:Putative signal transduction response regulator, receiver domain protein n=1 Tax=Nitrososphaera gargensis (strain Ga9.2) TaxID=1237085 RepID=K0IMW8_NITGG|nr:putative signal transduction response regulator, receiver domain protein [Candidatus Nitrososphaera gargensis Ga9.2]
MSQEQQLSPGRGIELSRAQSILVVDDELDIVTIFRQALSRYGYSVFGFTDPTLALEHFRLNAQDYALVISDVRMPQMSGFELAANIKAIKPDARIVLMSAFEVSDLEFSTSAVKTSDFLRKPVDIRTLVQKVKGAMAN